jgi:LPXTG-motif cell wall-anchored protein
MFAHNSSVLFGLALIASVVTLPVKAEQWDKKTTITITEPIQMPSCCNAEHLVVLQPGTYVMALVDSQSDRHIVRVFERDGTTVVTTTLAIPNYRLKRTDGTVFQFWETPAGQPRAMRAWFYPGDNFGQEFAYHKTKSIEIARTARKQVPAAVIETEAELNTAPVVVVDEKGAEKPLKVLVAANDPPAQTFERQVTTEKAPAKLPDTGSEYPLLGLMGIGSVVLSGLISRLSRRG